MSTRGVICELQLVEGRSGRRPRLGGIGTYMKRGILDVKMTRQNMLVRRRQHIDTSEFARGWQDERAPGRYLVCAGWNTHPPL